MGSFLADESCDFAAVRALRGAGHDVVAVAEIAGRAPDSEVLALAVESQRVLLTEDKDFGQLVFAAGQGANGVVLIRFPASARSGLGVAVVDACERLKGALSGAFVVLEPGRIRLTQLPGGSGR